MARFQAKFENRASVMRRLDAIAPGARVAAGKAQAEAAATLAEAIRSKAPSDTGEYRASIEAAPLSSRPGGKSVGIRQTKDQNAQGIFALYIWRFLEFGTVKMRARPHVFPTYRQRRKTIRAMISRAVNMAVKAAAK